MPRKEETAYDYRDFYRELRAGRLYRCYVLEGEEEFVKEQALRDLTDAVLSGPMRDMNLTRLTDPDADRLIAANETLPLMSEKRLVLVKDSGMLSGKAGDYDEETSAEALKAYFAHLPETSVLVFRVRGAADQRKRLFRTLKGCAADGVCAIVTFARMPESDLRKWVVKTCRERQVTISEDMATRMIFRAGSSLNQLKGETEKLCDYLGPGGTADEEALDAVVTRNIEYKVFDLARTVLEGDGARAFRMLAGLMDDGEEPLGLLALLGGQCRQLLRVAALTQAGERESGIAAAVGLPAFVVRQTQALARQYTLENIARMPELCVRTEYEIKSGLRPEEGSLEKVMLEIMSLRRPAAGRNQPAAAGRGGGAGKWKE